MFGIGMPELLIILVVALLVVGPKKLPDLAKSLGKGMREFRKATDEIKDSLSENESFKDLQNIRDDFKSTVDSMKVDNILDVENVLEPKEPETNLEGRKAVMDDLGKEEAEPGAAPEAEAVTEPPEDDAEAKTPEALPEAVSGEAAAAGPDAEHKAEAEAPGDEKKDTGPPKADG